MQKLEGKNNKYKGERIYPIGFDDSVLFLKKNFPGEALPFIYKFLLGYETVDLGTLGLSIVSPYKDDLQLELGVWIVEPHKRPSMVLLKACFDIIKTMGFNELVYFGKDINGLKLYEFDRMNYRCWRKFTGNYPHLEERIGPFEEGWKEKQFARRALQGARAISDRFQDSERRPNQVSIPYEDDEG